MNRDLEQRVAALEIKLTQCYEELRHEQKKLSTLGTPWWRKLLFRIDGWPPWWVVAKQPAWRPWRRFWRT